MSGPKTPRREDEDIIFLETESRSDVARALAEAERAIEAVEGRHRKSEGARPVAVATPAPEPAPPEPPVPSVRALATIFTSGTRGRISP